MPLPTMFTAQKKYGVDNTVDNTAVAFSEINSSTNLTDHGKAVDGGTMTEMVGEPASRTLDEKERLRMLGYDAVLGRPFDFWSGASLNLCHMSWIFEFVMYCAVYSFQGPLLFIIGYPCLLVLHFIIIGVFSELASTFPVAGAMATWSWQCARVGVRHERQWGYLVSGIVLAMHVGKCLSLIYNVTAGIVACYIYVTNIPSNPLTGVALNPLTWWNPVFQIVLVTTVALFTLTRFARLGAFWKVAAIFNLLLAITTFAALVLVARKTSRYPKYLDFGTRKEWTHGFSWMIFTGIPLRMTPIDCPAHMAEETKSPSKTVPRIMYASTMLHFTIVYVLVTMFIMIVIPYTHGLGSNSPLLPVALLLNFNKSGTVALIVLAIIAISLQVLAAVLVSSRFIFSLARDHGIPFSNFLVKTDKYGEPWVAMTILLVALYLSTIGWFMDKSRYYNLIAAFGFWFVNVAYVLPLILYATCHINLAEAGRSEFSLRRWSKPFAWVSILWMVLTIIQGSMPITIWENPANPALKVDTISTFPIVVVAMFAIMFVSWWIYGRRNYIGPVRALTKWSAGVDIDPNHLDSATGRADALKSYIDEQKGKNKSKSPVTSGDTRTPQTPVTAHRNLTPSSLPRKSSAFQRMLGLRSSNAASSAVASHEMTAMDRSVLPESGVLPDTDTRNTQAQSMDPALIESQLMPEESTLGAQQHRNSRASGRRHLSRPPVFNLVAEEAHHDHGDEEPYSTRHLDPRGWAAAQQESQLEPEHLQHVPQPGPASPYNSTLSVAGPHENEHAQVESQLEPVSAAATSPMYHDAHEYPVTQQESSLEPTATGYYLDNTSFAEPAAMQESQLEPRW